MKRMLVNVLKNKKGLTLIELIVGIIMFAVISLAISTLLSPMLMAFMGANDFAEYNSLLDNIANQIISDLSQSTTDPDFVASGGDNWLTDANGSLTITTSARIITYTVRNTAPGTGGVLQREGAREVLNADNELVFETFFFDVFSEDFYKHKAVSIMLKPEGGTGTTAFVLTVRLTSTANLASAGGNFELQRDYAVRPLMLNQT